MGAALFFLQSFCLILLVDSAAQHGILNLNPLSSLPASFATSTQAHNVPITTTWADSRPPLPTHAFFTNAVLPSGSLMPLSVLPYTVKLTSSALLVSYPERQVHPTFILTIFNEDLGLSSSEYMAHEIIAPLPSGDTALGYQLTTYDMLSATFTWQQQDGCVMSTPLVPGSPYMTMEYRNCTIAVTNSGGLFLTVRSKDDLTPINHLRRGTATGNEFDILVIRKEWEKWTVYWFDDTAQPITFDWTAYVLSSRERRSGVLRVVRMMDDELRPVFRTFNLMYPTGGTVQFDVTDNQALITLNWQTKSLSLNASEPGELLMWALPHHIDSLDLLSDTALAYAVLPGEWYQTIKGYGVAVAGTTWQLNETLPIIDWHAPQGVPEEYRDELMELLRRDMASPSIGAPDPYSFGKEIAALARLALIADELEMTLEATAIRDYMKGHLDPWLQGTNDDALLYDATWGGICSRQGLANPGADYGNGYYNDHLFHYGYFLYAIAVVAKEDMVWYRAHQPAVLDLVRDIANPSAADNYFPVTRQKDWYAGHSWASGLFPFGDGKNSESSSESVNGYYGLYLLGLAVGDKTIENLGRVMMATEIHAAKTYWQMPSTSEVYEPEFRAHTVVGMVWMTKVDYATWFGNQDEYIHCIQMLPFTPISEALLGFEWVIEEFQVLQRVLTRPDPPQEGWKGFIFMDQAIIDKQTALQNINTLQSYDNGNTATNTLYWVVTRPEQFPFDF